MRMLRAIAAIAALLLLTGCEWVEPNVKMDKLGPGFVQGRISYKPDELKCGFVLGVPAKGAGDLSYVGTPADKTVYEKCLTLKGNDQIRVTKLTKLIGKDKGKVSYIGVIDGVQIKLVAGKFDKG